MFFAVSQKLEVLKHTALGEMLCALGSIRSYMNHGAWNSRFGGTYASLSFVYWCVMGFVHVYRPQFWRYTGQSVPLDRARFQPLQVNPMGPDF